MRFILVSLWALWSLAAYAKETPIQPEFGPLVGSWQVEVEGEKRLRQLEVSGFRGQADGPGVLGAWYGWADGHLESVAAKAVLTDGKLRIEITTPAASVIVAEQLTADSLQGSFTSKSGNKKPIRLARIAYDLSDLTRAFADEEKDFGVAPTSTLTTRYHDKTPVSVPGATTIRTLALKALLDGQSPPIAIDVLGTMAGQRTTIPNAIWLGLNAGDGRVFAAENERFAAVLAKLTNDDKARAVVFFCLNSECWLSYNASLRAVAAGYKNVYWYRGGWTSWKAARLPLVKTEAFAW